VIWIILEPQNGCLGMGVKIIENKILSLKVGVTGSFPSVCLWDHKGIYANGYF